MSLPSVAVRPRHSPRRAREESLFDGIDFRYTLCIETMPRYLTEQDIADFRAELCKVATERFARFGYEGVTMRQLAEALGCSPKTPTATSRTRPTSWRRCARRPSPSSPIPSRRRRTGVTDASEARTG